MVSSAIAGRMRLAAGERGRRAAQARLIVAVAATIAISLAMSALTFSSHVLGYDDAYITYRYAENLAKGLGFVFNPGAAPVLGTSTPLYTGILAAGAWLGAGIPDLSIFVGAIATAVALGLIVLLAAEDGFLVAGVATAITLAISPALQLYTEGMETPLYLALILASIWAARRGWATIALVLGALTVLTRLDGVAALAVVVALLLLQRQWSWRAAVPGAAILALWLGLAFLLFGSPIPVSGIAKTSYQPEVIGSFSVFSPRLMRLAVPVTNVISMPYNIIAPWFAGALAVCTFVAAWKRPAMRAMAVWAALYVAGYESLRLPDFPWYYAPVGLVVSLSAWVAIQEGITAVAGLLGGDRKRLVEVSILAIAVGLSAIWLLALPGYRMARATQDSAHHLAGLWLQQHARPGQTVAAYEIGQVAYFSDLQTIDLLGLTEPEAKPYLARGDYGWAIRAYKPDYVFCNENSGWVVTKSIFSEPEFALNYRPVARFPYDENSDYVLYQRAGEMTAGKSAAGAEAKWLDLYYPESMGRSKTMPFSVVVQNTSGATWVAGKPEGVSVSYHWLDKNGRPVVWEGKRTALPCDVPSGGSVLVSALLEAPLEPGEYLLQWNLVQGEDGWFGERGVIAEPKAVSVR